MSLLYHEQAMMSSRPRPGVHAREAASAVTCLSDFDWMKNAKNQDPCLVASWSVEPCRQNSWAILPLTPDGPYQNFYMGPVPDSDLVECQCNTVHYSIIAACAFCQGYTNNQGIVNFSEFLDNCPNSSIRGSVYPMTIPLETDFPAWAYLNLLNDQWDDKSAHSLALQSVGAGSPSSDAPSSTSTSSSTGAGSSTQQSTPLSSTRGSTTTESSTSDDRAMGATSDDFTKSFQSAITIEDSRTTGQSSPVTTFTHEPPTSPTQPVSPDPARATPRVGVVVGVTVGGVALVALICAFLWLHRRRSRMRLLQREATPYPPEKLESPKGPASQATISTPTSRSPVARPSIPEDHSRSSESRYYFSLGSLVGASVGSSDGDVASPSTDLRAEVAALREEVTRLRQRQSVHSVTDEAPPDYTSRM
ncbi:hypothetical protein C8Q76DRAFT_726739 [Earliella scabrosa]|nr:hypothetical protein C8Q76DRAFT_726739 [Earliella scabrosa]